MGEELGSRKKMISVEVHLPRAVNAASSEGIFPRNEFSDRVKFFSVVISVS